MRLTWKLFLICLLLGLGALLPAAALAQEPNFSDEDDILHGQTHLLRADDLIYAYAQNATAAPYDNALYTSFLLTNQSAITDWQFFTTTTTTTIPITDTVQVAAGRMFDLPGDVAAVLAVQPPASPQPGVNAQLVATVHDRLGNRSLVRVIDPAAETSTVPLAALMADFTGDGFDDLAVSFGDAGSGFVVIVAAADPESWVAGLVTGPIYSTAAPLASLAAADVDGNGVRELVGVTNGAAATGAGGVMVVLGVDATTLAFTVQATTPLAAAGFQNRIASGDYDGDPSDDEVAVALAGTAGINPALQVYDFPNQPPVGVLLDQADPRNAPLTGIELVSGPVHWLGADGDAIIVAAENANAAEGGDYLLSVYTVVANKLALQATYTDGPNMNILDMALGRFDNVVTNGTFNADLQLAAIFASDVFGGEGYLLSFLTFGSNGSGYTVAENSVELLPLPYTDVLVQPALATGDLQGRSLRLGAPRKITINGHSAPSTVVGLPPMHLDWVVPSCADPNYPNNCTTPQQVEILAAPSSNYAALNTEVKASSQSSNQKTTSYSYATEESAEAGVSYGIPDIFSLSIEAKDTAKQTHDKTVATTANSYASVAFDASVRTGFADHVWFDNSRFNIWTYPVVGQTVCPQDKPNCAANEEVPLHVQFSGPDQINTYDLDGNVLEWYQPAWEPGNVLSYPWTAAQLAALLPRTTIVNKSDVWAADSSGSNASVTWSQGGGDDVSQGSTKTFANDASVSVAAEGSIGGFGLKAKTSFDYTTSRATQTLNTSSTTHGSSSGFNVAKTAQGVADYIFAAQTFILGQAPITGTLQTLPLTATLQTPGPLRLAYWANPYDAIASGDRWGTAYNLPDVALNHPQRWAWTSTPAQPNIMTFNHAVTITSPFDQEFYLMRGLYVTSQGAPAGPQIVTAPMTATVLLQARVYNYSHVDMNAASLAQRVAAVKVRFYGQVFRSEAGEYPVGESFLIGEQTLAPIPGFASTTTPGDVPNWRLAVQPLDLSAFAATRGGNVYLRFWVVTWMEDAAGNLVQEMAGHGLAANPNRANLQTLGDVPVEPYSNNAGTFKQVFYVAGPATGPAAGPGSRSGSGTGSDGAEAVAASGAPTLTLSAEPIVAAIQTPLGTTPAKLLLKTDITNGPSAQTALEVVYYDVGPDRRWRPFDWELIPYLAAGAQHVNRVTYTVPACGDRMLVTRVRFRDGSIFNYLRFINTPCRAMLPFVGKN